MLDKISISSIFFILFHELVTLLPIFHKPRQTNSCIRCAQRNMVITPGVINDRTEIKHFVQNQQNIVEIYFWHVAEIRTITRNIEGRKNLG